MKTWFLLRSCNYLHRVISPSFSSCTSQPLPSSLPPSRPPSHPPSLSPPLLSPQCHAFFFMVHFMAVRHWEVDPEDDPRKLEVAELKQGLTYLQVNLHYFTSKTDWIYTQRSSCPLTSLYTFIRQEWLLGRGRAWGHDQIIFRGSGVWSPRQWGPLMLILGRQTPGYPLYVNPTLYRQAKFYCY